MDEYTKKMQKVIVLGLENAGKTSLLSTFGGTLGIGELASLEPTRGVRRNKVTTDDMEFLIWDFGGQKDHRTQYLEEPNEFFSKIDSLLYVIDVQATEKFDESIDFFTRILNVLRKLKESPYLLIFIHKADPEIESSIAIQINIQHIKKSLESIIKKQDFDYEIYLTSIYSRFPRQHKFVKLVKDLITNNSISKASLEDKVNRFGDILESTLNAIVELSSKIMEIEEKMNSRDKTQVMEKNISSVKKSPLEKKNLDQKILLSNLVSEFNNIILKKEEKL